MLAFLINCVTLVLSVVPGLPFLCATVSGLFNLGALVTGMVGLTQVKRNNERGRGFAIAGLALGTLGMIAACLISLAGEALWAALGWQLGNGELIPLHG